MCFSCAPSISVDVDAGKIVYSRVADSSTRPEDFGMDAADVLAFEAGDWLYVGLSATLLDSWNRPVRTVTLLGIPERERDACAYLNELAGRWVAAEVLHPQQDWVLP